VPSPCDALNREVSYVVMPLTSAQLGVAQLGAFQLGAIAPVQTGVNTVTVFPEAEPQVAVPTDRRAQRQELQGAASVFGVGYVVGAVALHSPEAGLLLGLVCAVCWLQAGADEQP
jgi:hypothetical protein